MHFNTPHLNWNVYLLWARLYCWLFNMGVFKSKPGRFPALWSFAFNTLPCVILLILSTVIVIPFHVWENWGSVRCSNLYKVKSQVSRATGIPAQVLVAFPSCIPTSPPPYCSTCCSDQTWQGGQRGGVFHGCPLSCSVKSGVTGHGRKA